MTPIEEFNKADSLLEQGIYSEAADAYLKLMKEHTTLAPFCQYRLATISNNTGDPMTAYDLYSTAFSDNPELALILYSEGHPNKKYVFKGLKKEQELTSCPLCNNADIQPKWCYPLTEALGYNSHFNPIRLWMYCEPCHHIFSRYYPEKLFIHNDEPRTPNPVYFNYYSNILSRVSQFTRGMSLFEVGIGACECLLAAQEIGFDAFGIDVIARHVTMAREKFYLNAETADFGEYQSNKRYDIIIMGDVIEHVSDPVIAMKKAYELLNDDGALWISTPNFDSAFSIVAGHNDAMKRQPYHLNYFSRHSFYQLLDMCGFTPVDYSISSHYNGSMEIIAVKSTNYPFS